MFMEITGPNRNHAEKAEKNKGRLKIFFLPLITFLAFTLGMLHIGLYTEYF